jgi:hypothetical protein
VEFYEPLSKSQPFKSPFTIKNEGNSDLSTIFLKAVDLGKIVFDTPYFTNTHINNSVIGFDIILRENLEPNKSHTFTIDFLESFSKNTGLPAMDIISAQAQLKIFISYYWFFIKKEETFSFKIVHTKMVVLYGHQLIRETFNNSN